MLVFGIYDPFDKLYPATGLPQEISVTRSFVPFGRVSRAFVLAATPEEHKRAEEDKDLQALNGLFGNFRLRDLFMIATLTKTLNERYKNGALPETATVYAVEDDIYRSGALEAQEWVRHRVPPTKIGGVFATEEAAKTGTNIHAYQLVGGRYGGY